MATDTETTAPTGYPELLDRLKARGRETQFRAARAANVEVARLYRAIGRKILDRQRASGWGPQVVDRLVTDLRREFPEQRGWSRRNLLDMRRAAEVWPTADESVHQVGAQLPWRHVTVLLDRLGTREDRDWYAARAAAEGWSRAVLEHKIKAGLRSAVGAAPANFDTALDPAESDLARQLVRDPYVFEHLGMVRTRVERDVVVELKVGDFAPGHLGQLGAYVAAVDGELRRPDLHAPTVGILLCTGRDDDAVRYALASAAAPVAVADYQGLPAEARAGLPSAEELRAVVRDGLSGAAGGDVG